MNEIYFTNKGHTNKLNIPNIWPTREITHVRPEFFNGKKLVLLVDPILVDKAYYTAAFQIYDAERVNYYTLGDGTKVMMNAGFMWAYLIQGDITITTRNIGPAGLLKMDALEKARFWAYRDEALQLLKEGVAEFDRYFRVQKYKK